MEKIDKEKISEVIEKYGISLLILFGSQISGNTHKESDYDIAYLTDKRKLTLSEESNLIIDLGIIFKSENIDLVNLRSSPPFLLYAITQNCKIIYQENDLIFYSLRAYAFKRYIEEVKPLMEDKYKRLQSVI